MNKERTMDRQVKLKKLFNRKIILGVASLLIAVILIAVCSFVPFIIDPTRWQTTEFLTDELIVCAIVIFSMVSAVFIGQASNGQNEESNLAKARVNFFASVKRITDRNAFAQWVKKVLQPSDVRSIKERRLRENGIEDFRVLDLEFNEIKSLEESPQCFNNSKGEKIFYKGLSKEQVQAVLKIKGGKLKVNFVPPEYYLTAKNLIDTRTISERSSKEGTKKAAFLSKNIISRLLLTITTAMIFASLMRDLTASTDLAESTQKFVSRLWAMISSTFMGYITGCQINDIDAEYIEMRVAVQDMYLADKNFKPLTQQEEAKEEFINKVKKENEMTLENNSRFIEYKEGK